jgi:4-amino-4-deoxy-L-arabinose transferase-like glycosyltransferase
MRHRQYLSGARGPRSIGARRVYRDALAGEPAVGPSKTKGVAAMTQTVLSWVRAKDHSLDAWLGRLSVLLPWPAIAFLFFFFGRLWLRALAYPFQLDYGESSVLHASLDLLRGQPVYPHLGGYPYVATPYAPLYILLNALGLRLAGTGFFAGRLISLLSGLATAYLAALIVKRETGSRWAAALSAGLIVSVAYFSWWTVLVRIDALAWALSLLAFWLFLRGRLTWAVVACAAAIMTRQSAVAAPAAIILALLLERRRRQAGAAFAGLLALVAAAFLLTRATMGGGFYQHAVALPAHSGWLWWPLRFAGGLALSNWPALAGLGWLGACWGLARRQSGQDRRRAGLGLYFLIAWAISLTAGKIGAGPNYFVEPLILACLSAALVYHLARQASRPAGLFVSVAISAQLIYMALNVGGLLSYVTAPASAPGSVAVLARLAETPGPVICEDFSLLDLAGKDVLLEPLEFTQMVRAGLADPRPVLDDVRRGRFALIVMRMDPWRPLRLPGYTDYGWGGWYAPLVDEIARSYRLDQQVDGYYLLRPGAAERGSTK